MYIHKHTYTHIHTHTKTHTPTHTHTHMHIKYNCHNIIGLVRLLRVTLLNLTD